MFVHNLDPVLFSLGPLTIRWYGLVYVLGFLFVMWWLSLLVKKDKLNLKANEVYDLVLYLIIGVIVGARVFEVFVWNPGYYFSNPSMILAVWRGGLSFHGALVGAVATMWWFSKKKKISFWKLADILIIPAAFFLGLGRIANFINGELWGKVTNVSWCVEFKRTIGCRHPSQLYESFKNFILFGILIWINRKEHKDGFIFWNFVWLYGLGRFITDLFREGAVVGQVLNVLMVFLGLYILFKFYRQKS